MTIVLVLILIIILFALYFLFRKLSKGVLKTIVSFDMYIDWLLNKGYSNYATLVIEVKGGPQFIQLHKYGSLRKNNVFGIQMDFPIVDWSEIYEEKLVKLCQQNDITWKEEKGSDGLRFIVIDFEKNTKLAIEIAKKTATTIFNLSGDQKYYLSLNNCERE